MDDVLSYALPKPGEPFDRVKVTVTFLRMLSRPNRPVVSLPVGATLESGPVSVAEYRKMYAEIGGPWLWWMRRMMPDGLLARHLAASTLHISRLMVDGEVAGFYETDASYWPFVNLNYFGLKEKFIGQGLGRLLLDAAVDSVFFGGSPLRGMTVNTCTADHPRALPNYKAAGFSVYRSVDEEWDIPTRLGLTIPANLLA